VPFVAKVVGLPVAKIAARIMAGEDLASFKLEPGRFAPGTATHIGVKEAVFPFARFGEKVDTVLGPEMKSTGEVMGIDTDFRKAYLKSQTAAGSTLPASGKIFISVRQRDKRALASLARRLTEMGFGLVATVGTARVFERQGMTVQMTNKVVDVDRPNVIDLMKQGEIAMVIETPGDGRARKDSYLIRRAAVNLNVPYYLTVDGAQAAIGAIEALLKGEIHVRTLQEYHADA
jgi:carbamoyl-phosphate synthase large subunit